MKKTIITLPLAILLLLAFAPPLNLTNGWYQQFMPNLGGATIKDITFTDSLNGFAVTSLRTANDSAYILKTTNGGDNWSIKFMHNKAFVRVQFINSNTGFTNAFTKIFKTTDAGETWNAINLPSIFGDDMFVLNDTIIWLAMSESLTGGVFRTTNGGASWDHQFSGGNQNPNRIYMYNARIGFISNSSALPNIYKTTNSGLNWDVLVNGERFFDISFVDSLTGWRTRGDTMKFTSNGGLNWVNQTLPYGGIIQSNVISRFSVINKDTIWGSGGYVHYPNNQYRGILYRTINGGINWQFQIPDTSLPIAAQYEFIKFANSKNGWCYANYPTYVTGIHTTTGGNDTFYTGIQQVSIKIPNDYKLFQNYPNPFNPKTIIKYEVRSQMTEVRLVVYDILGKELIAIVDKQQNAGTYQVDFSGNGYSSGIYFYSLTVNNQLIDTKKMILLK